MADNVVVSQGVGTNMATNEISGVHYPRQKIGFGVPGSFSDVSASSPMPVTVVGSSSNVITNVLPGAASIPYGTTVALISVTPITAITTKFLVVGGDSDGSFELLIGGLSFGKFRISWNQRTYAVPLGQIQITSGTPILLNATCSSLSGQSGDYEAYVYY